MTIAEAGELYLEVICPSNTANTALSDEANAAFIPGTPLDVAAANEKAAASRDAYRAVIEQFSDEATIWPEAVDADVDTFLENIYTDIALTGQMADAPDEMSFIGPWNSWTDPARHAEIAGIPQKIRAKLELSADSKASCEGR